MKKSIILISVFCMFNLTSFSQVYKFKSTETDVEAPNQEVHTKYEVCYHTFDYNKSQVIFESLNSKGEKTKIIEVSN